jgi:hypothetical protein
MHEMLQVRRAIATALTAALVFAAGAQCLVGHESTGGQMACCEGTDHDCHSTVAAPACCQNGSAEQAEVVAYLPPLVAPPVLNVSTVQALARPASEPSGIRIETTSLEGSSPPKYVLLGSFLI